MPKQIQAIHVIHFAKKGRRKCKIPLNLLRKQIDIKHQFKKKGKKIKV